MAYETCKGYSYCKRYKTWRAKVKIDGVYYYLGSFDTERAAGLAVDKKLIAMGKEPRNVLKRFKATGTTQLLNRVVAPLLKVEASRVRKSGK